jgi:hypothetical protein
MNSQVTLNGVPMMIDTNQGGWSAVFNVLANLAASMDSTVAPTNMKKE